MKHKVFVDGQEGTTGLKINERLNARNEASGDIDILRIDPDKKKDEREREKYLNAADIVFLCLPDDAARTAVSLVKNPQTIIIDASTAHRTLDSWAYGIPELSPAHRLKLESSKRASVPGCHASGFNMLIYPLVAQGILPEDYPVTCHSVTGYSGGGKKLIDRYEAKNDKALMASPCFYSLTLKHKHLNEMRLTCRLKNNPLFTPIVADFYQGMTVAVPLCARLLNKQPAAADIRGLLAEYYNGCVFVKVMPEGPYLTAETGYFPATVANGTNRMELFVFGDDSQMLLLARFDNLGKGSSGAAVQAMNIMLGEDESLGLKI